MAQPSISDEELQLRKRARRRLVGAVALVAILVVFLPMVLDNEPKPVGQDVAIRIPSRDGDAFSPKIVPVPQNNPSPSDGQPASDAAAPPAPASGAGHVEPSPTGAANKPAAAEPSPAPASKPTAPPEKPAAKPEPPKPAPKAPAADGTHAKAPESIQKEMFAVQLGAFSHADNVKQLRAKLAANGIKSYTEVLKTGSGEQTRVRAGPFASREEAEKVLDKLKRLGIKGVIVPEPSAHSAGKG